MRRASTTANAVSNGTGSTTTLSRSVPAASSGLHKSASPSLKVACTWALVAFDISGLGCSRPRSFFPGERKPTNQPYQNHHHQQPHHHHSSSSCTKSAQQKEQQRCTLCNTKYSHFALFLSYFLRAINTNQQPQQHHNQQQHIDSEWANP